MSTVSPATAILRQMQNLHKTDPKYIELRTELHKMCYVTILTIEDFYTAKDADFRGSMRIGPGLSDSDKSTIELFNLPNTNFMKPRTNAEDEANRLKKRHKRKVNKANKRAKKAAAAVGGAVGSGAGDAGGSGGGA